MARTVQNIICSIGNVTTTTRVSADPHPAPEERTEIERFGLLCKFIGSFISLDNPWLCCFLRPSPPRPFPHKTLTLNPSFGYAEEPVLAGEVEPRSWRIRAILPRSPRDWSHFWAKAVRERPPPRCLPPRFIPSLLSSRSHLLRSLTYIRFSVDLAMLLEPLDRMKKVDSRLNLTQGVLEGVGMQLL
ncbi:hypothetical protein BHM03_00028200 [Ensete ventricosum]|nr:hypothetical protein BHM03_00028200 [Ensete ventricosum]